MRSGLARFSSRKAEGGAESCAHSAFVDNLILSRLNSLSGEVMDGSWLMRAINNNRDGLSAMEVTAASLSLCSRSPRGRQKLSQPKKKKEISHKKSAYP